MPVYEYTCAQCRHVTEAIRRMADADKPQPCEECGSGRTTREFSLFNAGHSGPSAGDPGPCGLPMGGPPGMGGCCGGACSGH